MSRGFTLVEILVAFTILAMFIATAFQVFSTGVRSNTLAAEYQRAQSLARSRLDAVAASPALEAGEENGRAVSNGDALELLWSTRVEEYELADDTGLATRARVTPLLATVEVTWTDGDPSAVPRSVQLRALLLGPLP